MKTMALFLVFAIALSPVLTAATVTAQDSLTAWYSDKTNTEQDIAEIKKLLNQTRDELAMTRMIGSVGFIVIVSAAVLFFAQYKAEHK